MIHQTQGANAGAWMLNKHRRLFSRHDHLAESAQCQLQHGRAGPRRKAIHQCHCAAAALLDHQAWNGTTGGILAFLANGTVTVSAVDTLPMSSVFVEAWSAAIPTVAKVVKASTLGGNGGARTRHLPSTGAEVVGRGDRPMPVHLPVPNSGGAGGGYAKGTDANQDEGAGGGGGGGHVYGGGGGGGGQDSMFWGHRWLVKCSLGRRRRWRRCECWRGKRTARRRGRRRSWRKRIHRRWR